MWFRLHMLLGIAGPVLIIFHSNFKLGALNSNVAFITMLVVATSGCWQVSLWQNSYGPLRPRKAEGAGCPGGSGGAADVAGHELEAANYT